jgi:hypothetical protein
MDVIGFLFASIGSSTVQLHDRLGRAGWALPWPYLYLQFFSHNKRKSLGSIYACACSEAGFRGQIGDRA